MLPPSSEGGASAEIFIKDPHQMPNAWITWGVRATTKSRGTRMNGSEKNSERIHNGLKLASGMSAIPGKQKASGNGGLQQTELVMPWTA